MNEMFKINKKMLQELLQLFVNKIFFKILTSEITVLIFLLCRSLSTRVLISKKKNLSHKYVLPFFITSDFP